MNEKKIDFIDNIYFFECPHCDLLIEVEKNEINCKIFRHAVLKDSGQQINPHASKIDCDNLFSKNLVYGCAKPFKILLNENGIPITAVICDYI